MKLTRTQMLTTAPALILTAMAVAVVGLSAADAANGSFSPTQIAPVASEAAPSTSTRDWQELQASRTRGGFR